jgi:hypothetical protein
MVMVSGTTVQQYTASTTLDALKFAIVASGANWKISPKTDATRCLDGGSGATGTALAVMPCTGASQQSWQITPDVQTGTFVLHDANGGRCMNVRGGSTAAGVPIELSDCSSASGQKFALKPLP